MNNEIEALQKEAKYYFDNKKIIHVAYKDGSWNNGTIKEFFGDGFILIDFKDGEMPIFYLRVKKVSIYTTRDEVKK